MAESLSWLAKVLRGDVPVHELIPGPFAAVDEALTAAASEQVLGLIAERMQSLPRTHSWSEAFANSARKIAVRALLRDEECRRVLEWMHEAGLSPLLLKGGAFAHWLYPSPWLREAADIDLLFADAREAEHAANALRAKGYSGGTYFGGEAHETVCRRPQSMEIDLHWGIVNSPLFASRLPFSELREQSLPLPSLSKFALTLCPVHAIIHACMHRVINLHMGTGDRLKWLYDLSLMLPRMSVQEWRSVLDLCAERELGGVCLDAFEAVNRTFATKIPSHVLLALEQLEPGELLNRKRLHNWSYIQRQTLASFPTLGGRFRWLGQRMFPSFPYLRSVYGEDLGPAALIVERIRRFASRAR